MFISDKWINPFDNYVSKNEEHITGIEQADSVINIASEQIDKVQIQNSQVYDKLDSLGNTVVLNELTIEEQVVELNKLLKLANEANKTAQEQKELAIKYQEMAEIAKMNATAEKMIAQMNYTKLLEENNKLKLEIKQLKKKVGSTFSYIKSDTLLIDDSELAPIIDENKTKKKKKKD